jgi:hypothetical protein
MGRVMMRSNGKEETRSYQAFPAIPPVSDVPAGASTTQKDVGGEERAPTDIRDRLQTSLPPQPSFSFLSATAGYCLNGVVDGVLCLTGW